MKHHNAPAGGKKSGPAACLTTAEIEAKLKAAGVQPTLQRIAICRYVLCEADHPSAEDVKNWADKNLDKISLATVYNTLNTLADAGLLRAFRLAHSEKIIYDHNVLDHYHFIDEKSGQLFDIDPAHVECKLKLPKKYKVKNFEIFFKGEFKS